VVNRRHIRAKVMQSIYAMHQNGNEDIAKQEKFLYFSIENILDLYLTMISVLTEVRKKEAIFIEKSSQKHLATKEEKNPNLKFVNNQVLNFLANNEKLNSAIEERKIDTWNLHDDYILLILEQIKQSLVYQKYLANPVSNFEEDKRFIEYIFEFIIVPDEKLYEYFEDNRLTWIDDIPLVNTLIQRQLGDLISGNDAKFTIPKLFKDSDDKEFVSLLFRKTVLNETEFEKEYADKTPNWDTERIAEIDTIILKMAICEFLKFPSIPTKVSINEYVEIAKEYSTPKSSIFINGILDVIVKELTVNKKIEKTGRGLM
jgi:transcription antitermination protein NusB